MKKNFINFFIVNFSSVLNLLSIFFIQYFLSISLNIVNYGIFSSVIALVFIFLPFINYGVSTHIVKDNIIKDVSNLHNILNLFLILLTLNIIIFFIVLYFLFDLKTYVILVAFSFHLLSLSLFEVVYSIYQLKFQYLRILYLIVFFNFLKMICFSVIYLFFKQVSLDFVALIFFIFSLPIIVLFIYEFNLEIYNIIKNKFYLKINTLYNEFKRLSVFGISGILFYFYYYSDVIMINFILGYEMSGYFALALSFIFLIYLFPTITVDKLLQNYFYYYYQNKEYKKLNRIYNYTIIFFFIVSLILTYMTYKYSSNIFNIIYEDKFLITSNLITIMAFGIVFRFLSIANNGFVRAISDMKGFTYILIYLTFFKFLLNIIIISNFNYELIAYSFVFFEIVYLLLLFIYKRKLELNVY